MSAINEVLDAIASRFKSGNSIPVERVHITTAELSRLQSSLAEKDETIANLRARCEAAEKMVGVARVFANCGFCADDHHGLRNALRAYDAAIAAQHAQRKEGES